MTEVFQPSSEGTPPACLPPRMRKRRFNPPEAVEYLAEAHGLPVAAATLAKLRSLGGGPEFLKFGRAVLYDRQALDAWASEKLGSPRRNTSE